MLLDTVAIAILALYVALGLWRGTLASASGLVSLILGYWAGFTASSRFGPLLAERLDVSELIGAPLAGSAGFLVTWIACSICFRIVRRAAEMRRAGSPRSAADRFGGVVFGFARGALIVVLLGWLALWLDAARTLNSETPTESAVAASGVADLSGAVVERALISALSDSPGGRVVARMAARPAEALGSMRSLIEDERVQAVQEDSLFWSYVQNDAVENALNRRSFWRIVHDDELRGRFAELGLISQVAADDPAVFREAAGEVLEELGPRIKGLSEDPELQELARDPEVVAMLESGDTFGLLTHPGIRRVVARVSEGVSKPAEDPADDLSQAADADATQLGWRD